MKNSIDIHKVLQAFNLISKNGDKTPDGFSYQGFYAQSDFDGYNLYLTDKQTELHIFFHNKYELNAPSNELADKFIKRLLALK
ncbi:DUF3081 family protein [Catenovulum sp. SM1970]|uniref:DUF3081 family protein n=1 Tax=Marinifaba aquimaris TaxID=2741323 RepID=UPI001573CC49|nr:DUF3081 family protein [Marinifaba aquimaris]NTS75435.1 DUF3081 family protein [Marinifaba aquimaris]